MPAGLEIERRYLLSSAPSDGELADLGARPHRIEQVCLRSGDGWVRRVRKVEAEGRTRHIATRKREIDGIVREEHEDELDLDAYDLRLAEADPARRTIHKVRHVSAFAGHVLGLDVFSDPADLILLEVELEDASEVPDLPPAILGRLIREAGLERAYMSHEIALQVPAGARNLPLDGEPPGAARSAT